MICYPVMILLRFFILVFEITNASGTFTGRVEPRIVGDLLESLQALFSVGFTSSFCKCFILVFKNPQRVYYFHRLSRTKDCWRTSVKSSELLEVKVLQAFWVSSLIDLINKSGHFELFFSFSIFWAIFQSLYTLSCIK